MLTPLLLGAALSATPPDALIIRDATVISAEAPAPRPNTDILVVDGVIEAIGSELRVPENAQIVEADDRYVIPGLIDSHVHLYHATGMRRGLVSRERERELRRAYFEQLPRSFLYWGFTSVVELNAHLPTNDAFDALPLHPRMYHCGPGVVLADGYMALDMGDVTDYPFVLHDPYGGDALLPGSDPADHMPAAVLDRLQDTGAICVKLFYEEAIWWEDAPPYSLPSPEILREVDREAAARGMTTLMHATAQEGHRIGLEVGIDVMAHGVWDYPGLSYDDPDLPSEAMELFRQQGRAGQAIHPTMRAIRNTASMFDPGVLTDPQLDHVLPSEYIAYLRTEAQPQRDQFMARFADLLQRGAGVEDVARLQAAMNARYERQTGFLSQNGAQLLFGTDTAVGAFGWGNAPGLNGYLEMQGWVRGGVSLEDLFDALTLRNARALGLDHELGSVEVGKRADLLILDASPLQSVEAYDSIQLIILDGQPIARANLSALAGP